MTYSYGRLYNKVLLKFGQKIIKILKKHKILLTIEQKCVPWQLKENGQANLKISKNKFIYLISPNKIYQNFYGDLSKVLKTGKISFFQMRLKNYSLKRKIYIEKLRKNVKTIQNL